MQAGWEQLLELGGRRKWRIFDRLSPLTRQIATKNFPSSSDRDVDAQGDAPAGPCGLQQIVKAIFSWPAYMLDSSIACSCASF